MEEQEDLKKLKIILGIMITIIILILILYVVTYLFKVEDNDEDFGVPVTTKVKSMVYIDLNKDEKKMINEDLANNNILISFNNAFDNNYELLNVDLLKSEENKFKFIYTYLKLEDPDIKIDFSILDSRSVKMFNAMLYSNNFVSYIENGYYNYEIKYKDVEYCLKAVKKKDDIILFDMIAFQEESCDINTATYNDEVLHQIEIEYEKQEDNYIYKSFIVVK